MGRVWGENSMFLLWDLGLEYDHGSACEVRICDWMGLPSDEDESDDDDSGDDLDDPTVTNGSIWLQLAKHSFLQCV